MNRSLLICGNSDILTRPLVEHAGSGGFRVVVARPAEVSDDTPMAGAVTIAWNRRSPLSARSLLMQTESAVSRLTDIVYIHHCGARGGRSAAFHEISIRDLERTIDDETTGRLFLLKEAIAQLQRNGGGSLSLVLCGSVDAGTQPLEAELAGGFVAFARSLFTWYQNEPVVLRGYQTDETVAEDFGRLLVEDLTGDGARAIGKWYRFAARSGLFSFGR